MLKIKNTSSHIFLLVFIILGTITISYSAERNIIEEIKENKQLLREIAVSIINRPQTQEELQQKICKHDSKMYSAWESEKKWGQLGLELQKELTKCLPKSKVQDILYGSNSSSFYLMDDEIINNVVKYAQEVIEKGEPTVITIGLKQDRYSLNISYNINPKISGRFYTRGGAHQNIHSLCIGFDITDIVSQIEKHGLKQLDLKMAGSITTFFPQK